MIVLKSQREIEYMKDAGKIVAETHKIVGKAVKPGVSTIELDTLAENYILSKGAMPSFKGYHDYPATICASVNEEVVHGIPDERILAEGDILSVDIGAVINGYHGDAAITHPVGTVSELAKRLLEVTESCLAEGIKMAREENRLSDISHTIQTYVENNGFSVVRDFVGHGIGNELHELPQIPNFGPPDKGPRLRAGMCLAIEPMVNAGGYEVKTTSDNWTVVTEDGSLSAHFEHTIALTDTEPIILTKV